MSVTTDTIRFPSGVGDSAVEPDAYGFLPASDRPSVQQRIVVAAGRSVLDALAANSEEVIDEGGVPLEAAARDFLARAATELTAATMLNTNFSIEDFMLTPFARSDGGGELLIDFARTGKQLAVNVLPGDGPAAIVLDGPAQSHGVHVMRGPDEIRQYLGWLTKPE